MKRFLKVIRDVLLSVLIVLFLGLVIVRLDSMQEEAVTGRARVVDGDTLVVEGKRIRLAGIDAPELRQVCRRGQQVWPCGAQAKDRLAALLGDRKVDCRAGGSDRYGRLIGVCTVSGRDLNAAMVGAGYAIAFGDYEAEEDIARSGRLGLWAGTFDTPRAWRKTHGGIDEVPHIQDGWLGAVASMVDTWFEGVFSGQ